MGEKIIKIKVYVCERCKYSWTPKDPNKKPAVCARCKNRYWDKPIKFPTISKANKFKR